jgi:hypothetical protein
VADLSARGGPRAGPEAQEGGMKGRNNLGSVYNRLTPEERFQLVLEATARQDETEVERLANTCQRYRYTSGRNEPAYSDRIQASRKITICVCLVLMEISAKLMLIRTSQQYVTLLSRSLITEFERGCRRGWEAGCDHVWLSAGIAGPFPWRDNGDLGERADEGQDADEGGDDDELGTVSEALATEVRTLLEAFSRFCRTEMGSAPETVLLAWFPPMHGWIEGALNAAEDAGRVDADVLLEYEAALTKAWREFLREA